MQKVFNKIQQILMIRALRKLGNENNFLKQITGIYEKNIYVVCFSADNMIAHVGDAEESAKKATKTIK